MTALDEKSLEERCAGRRWIGRRIIVLPETASTNDVCHDLAGRGAAAGTVVFAEQQTAGRGQQGNSWHAPPRTSLLFSILLRPVEGLDQPAFLTAWSALAVAGELDERYGLEARIKWPNDVRVAGRKLCGILVEKRMGTVVGIGLNVSISPRQFPVELRRLATSVSSEVGRSVERGALAAGLLRRLDDLYDWAVRCGPEELFEQWTTFAENPGAAPIAAITRQTRVVGRLLELRPDRGARVARSDGSVARIPAQELLRLEPVESSEVLHAHR